MTVTAERNIVPAMKTLLIILLLAIATLAQNDTAQFDRWRGMVLDESTPEQALATFQKPKSDKAGQKYRPIKYNEWFDTKSKLFRELHFEGIEGFKDVKLYFLKEKLVCIHLEPEKLAASILPQTYGTELEILIGDADKAFNPRGGYPDMYSVMKKTNNSYFFAMIFNTSFGAIMGKSMGIQQKDLNSMPGKVGAIQMISRTLESSKGTNLLK